LKEESGKENGERLLCELKVERVTLSLIPHMKRGYGESDWIGKGKNERKSFTKG
jgi:hypothetical protein